MSRVRSVLVKGIDVSRPPSDDKCLRGASQAVKAGQFAGGNSQ
jgi:hypothetical protein